ncbi:MAG: ABC transporter substrate-binding protein [Pseudonocardia sp.]|nr:ABC transporter substrate-binding protein [Pseudonocardia sp.]
MRSRTRWAALAAAAALALLTGCGGAGGAGGGGGGATPGSPAPVPGFDGKTIKLGVLTALSGPVAVIGNPLLAGTKVWFDAVNAKGGIAGKYKVELVAEDTQYKTDLTVQQYNKIKGDVVMIGQSLGTPTTLAILPLLKADGAMAGAATLDALWVREPNLLPVGGPYQVQAINAVNYYLTDGGGSPSDPICSMIQDDAYGNAGQAGLDFVAQAKGFTIANTQRFKAGTADYTGAIQALAGANCKLVFLVATPSDAAKIWGKAAQVGFPGKWIGQSPSWINALAKAPFTPYLQSNVMIVAEGTEWGDTSVPGMKDMIERQQQFAPSQEPDYYFAFGYNQGRALTALLEKAVERGDLSKPGLLTASAALGTVSFDGLTGDYQYGPAETRNPPRTSTIFKIDPAKPFGLATAKYNFTSPEAKAYEFKKANL